MCQAFVVMVVSVSPKQNILGLRVHASQTLKGSRDVTASYLLSLRVTEAFRRAFKMFVQFFNRYEYRLISSSDPLLTMV